jgi:uncharacterized protein with FMN-binding domain
VIIEGPSGGLTSAARRHRGSRSSPAAWASRRSARCWRTPGRAGTIAVIYRAASEDDVLFRDELDELARRRGAELHYVLGERRGDELLSAEHLRALVPDIASRDVYVCGPPRMTRPTLASLRAPASRAATSSARVRLVNGRVVARRAVPAAVATAAVVALLANVRAGRRRSRRRPAPGDSRRRSARRRAAVRRREQPRPTRKGPVRTATETATTPFSIIQLRVTLTGGELTRVETLELSGDNARTEAINAAPSRSCARRR